MRVVAITTAMGSLALCMVALRLWVRLFLIRSPGLDDVAIVAALICAIVLYAFIILEHQSGLGVPTQDLPNHVASQQMHWLWFSVPFYNLSLILTKLSGVFFFLRIFPPALIQNLGIHLHGITGYFRIMGSSKWVSLLCSNDKLLDMAFIATDIALMITPMPLLSKLQLQRRKKIAVILIFCVGLIVVVISSIRLNELSRMINGDDVSVRNESATVWSSLEVDVSLICACLPPLNPLFSRIFAYLFRPRPLHSSPASNAQSYAMSLTSDRKRSIYDHQIGPEAGVFANDIFFAGPAGYSASISKVDTNQSDAEKEDGIRVVRELRVGSDSRHSPGLVPKDPHDRDLEMASGSSKTGPGIEWDLGDFEFQEYKERMNAPM
ncbi:hypothetical protein N7468_009518 [Penicillium chermesinum]|uniref:Rhodopsin domain-containing protein n=1 Tax=Penicillium chermesinum TaxID=63820 RepID=A0A9W9NKD8_9EURO|nr:uncharacterized protein N7468_009518 [Penicillium chermesinum]KAJ5220314.1 hypothetical protein N7468_009518 [Penicillium chermesinum]